MDYFHLISELLLLSVLKIILIITHIDRTSNRFQTHFELETPPIIQSYSYRTRLVVKHSCPERAVG